MPEGSFLEDAKGGLVVEPRSIRNFNFEPIKNLPENMHQRPHLERFWEPGGQEHIFDKSGWVWNFAKELQTRN